MCVQTNNATKDTQHTHIIHTNHTLVIHVMRTTTLSLTVPFKHEAQGNAGNACERVPTQSTLGVVAIATGLSFTPGACRVSTVATVIPVLQFCTDTTPLADATTYRLVLTGWKRQHSTGVCE